MNVLLGRIKAVFWYVAGFSFFINVLTLIPSLYMMQVFDRVINSRSIATLVALTVGAAVALLVMLLLEFVRSRLLVAAGVMLDGWLWSKLVDGLVGQAAELHKTRQEGSLRDLHILRNFLTGSSIYAVFDAPWLLVYLAIIFLFSTALGWAAVAGTVVLVVLGLINERMTHRAVDALQMQSAMAMRAVDMGVQQAEAIQGLGMLPVLKARWAALNHEALRLQVMSSHVAGTITGLTRFARQFVQTLMMCIGVYLLIDNQSTSPGVLLAATFIVSRAMMPIEQLIGMWGQLIEARAAYQRVKNLLVAPDAAGGGVSLPPPQGHVTIEQLYLVPAGGGKPILSNIQLDITAGMSVGLVGPSASGKSSLARIITGIWTPNAGTVRYDGADISAWPRAELGKYIGYLPQEVSLFAGTVAQNIARFNEANGVIDSEAVIAAAKLARVHELILRLPNGYDTFLGDGGLGLSGGQRQRIGLARALYGHPRLVVLDEPNSNLDAEGEASLMGVFADLRAAKVTLIVIVHRPSLLLGFDGLVVLAQGAVVQTGPTAQVLKQLAPEVAV